MLPFDKEPDYVNAEGTKWWIEDVLTTYAQQKGLDMKCYIIETVDKYRSYVGVMDGTIVAENQSIEAFSIRIDMIAYLNQDTA